MKRLTSAYLAVAVMLVAAFPAVATDYNPSGNTAPGQSSTTGQSLQSTFPGTIPEDRAKGNFRCPNQLIVGGDQTVQDRSNGINQWSRIPSMVLRPFGKRPKDALDTTIIWTTPSAARLYTIPDAGGSSSFALLSGGQSVAGVLSRADMVTEAGVTLKRNLLDGRYLDGSVLVAAAAAGKFGIGTTATFGSPATLSLVTESANSNTKTDNVEYEFTLPPDYVAGSAITVAVTQAITIGGGTLSVKTLTVDAFKMAADGTAGSNLGPVAQNLTNASSTLSFAITPTGLVAGNKLLIQLQTVLTETAASAVTANITDIAITTSVKM